MLLLHGGGLRDGFGVRLPAPGQRAGRGRRHRRGRARLPARPGAPVPRRPRGRAARLRLDARLRRPAGADRGGRRLRRRRARALAADHAEAPGPAAARAGRCTSAPASTSASPTTSSCRTEPQPAVSVAQLRSFARGLPRRHLAGRRGRQRAARRPHRLPADADPGRHRRRPRQGRPPARRPRPRLRASTCSSSCTRSPRTTSSLLVVPARGRPTRWSRPGAFVRRIHARAVPGRDHGTAPA